MRLRKFYLSRDSFVKIFKTGVKLTCLKGIPEDAQLIGITNDFAKKRVVVVVKSKEFSNLRDGEDIPEIAPEFEMEVP